MSSEFTSAGRGGSPRLSSTKRLGWRGVAVIFVTFLAPLLGGSSERWSQGLVLVGIGMIALFVPPKVRLSPVLLAALIAFGLLALTGFLPANWFAIPAWRQELAQLGLALPGTLSPQPWLTGEAFILFLGGALWLSWLGSQDWSPSQRQWLARGYAGGVIACGALFLVLFSWKVAPPFWSNERGFGPFPNRNHTANFLALGGILCAACAQQSWRENRRTWPLWLIGFGAVLAAVIVDYSRAGVIFLLGGVAVWLLLLAAFAGSIKRVAIAFSSIVSLFSLFVLFGGGTLARFQQEFTPSLRGVLGFRHLVFEDTLRLITGSPWCGIGLANFRSVFPFFRDQVSVDAVLLHPESDWLWTASELGWPGVAIILVGIVALFTRVFPLAEGSQRRLRAAAFLAAIAFLLHGFVDVAGHRLGSILPAMLVFSLAPRPLGSPSPTCAAPWFFRLFGAAMVAIGLFWAAGTWLGWSIPGARGVSLAKEKVAQLRSNDRIQETIRLTSEALRWAPLDGQLYFSRAVAHAYSGQTVMALGDFRRARRLDLFLASIPLAEGRVWLGVRPAFALPVWQELLARHRGTATAPSLYGRMLALTPRDSPVRPALSQFAEGQLDLQLTLLAQGQPAELPPVLNAIFTADPTLERLTDAQKTTVFTAWARTGDTANLARQLEANPAWLSSGWRILAQHYATTGSFQSACELALTYLPRPTLPRLVKPTLPIAKLQRNVFINPADFASAYTLFTIQVDSGNLDGALDNARRVLAQPGCPPYFRSLQANLHLQRGEWREAWNVLAPTVVK